jgi:hypothetical protein
MTPVIRIGLVFALGLSTLPLWVARAAQPAKAQDFTGKVVPLGDVLGPFGAKLDPDAAPHWLALVADDGKVYPLIKDNGSRMFFKEPKLRGRPMRLTGRLLPGSQLLQVLNVHSLKDGRLHEIYYWCEVCIIKRYEPGVCECCGGPMEYREEPAKR